MTAVPTGAQLLIAKQMSEAELLEAIAEGRDSLVKALGGMYYHPRRSDRSVKGWPDLVIWVPIRPRVLVLAELKATAGRWEPEQLDWRGILEQIGGNVEYRAWRPIDWLWNPGLLHQG